MNKKLEEYLYWTRRERNGVITLVVLIIIAWASSQIFELFYEPPPTDFTEFFEIIKRDSIAKSQKIKSNTPQITMFDFDPNTASETDFITLGLSTKIISTITNYRDKGGYFSKKTDLKKIYGLTDKDYHRLEPFIQFHNNKAVAVSHKIPPKKLFNFNPNTATIDVFIQLGLNPKTANNIVKYRNKGGFFRKKEDFKKIYGISPNTYKRLEPYINIPTNKTSSPNITKEREKTPNAYNKKKYTKAPIVIDINKSTQNEWQQLRGIGKKRAERIVEFRDKLGGFGSINQIADTWGLPDSIFRAIRPSLRVSPVLKKIAVNTVSFKELLRHPLFNYNKTQIIINYRYQHGDYHSMEDVRKVGGSFTNADFDKIAPYLSFQASQNNSQ